MTKTWHDNAGRLQRCRVTRGGGFLDNRKNNADRLLARIRDVMQAQFAFADIVWRPKFIYSRTAAPEILEELAERCQFVITAIGD